ncbi:hypothetical protein NMY22_g11297 [Coprinellus aureogranulatus]|nr:hypothetical protein NMY22_g11297 [Coprinellus aureogranulatus]
MMFMQLSKPGMTVVAAHGAGRTTLRILPTSSRSRMFATKQNPQHNPDTYAKDDADPTPPQGDKVFKVDSSSENVQRPTEPLSGEWSRAGARTSEYEHTDSTLKTPGGPGLRYGGKEKYKEEKGPETSGSSEGPEAKSRGGRK